MIFHRFLCSIFEIEIKEDGRIKLMLSLLCGVSFIILSMFINNECLIVSNLLIYRVIFKQRIVKDD